MLIVNSWVNSVCVEIAQVELTMVIKKTANVMQVPKHLCPPPNIKLILSE